MLRLEIHQATLELEQIAEKMSEEIALCQSIDGPGYVKLEPKDASRFVQALHLCVRVFRKMNEMEKK